MALLQDDFWPAIFHDDAACGIMLDNHCIESQSAHITSCFLELEKLNQDLESKLRDDFNNILNSMDKLSLSPSPQPPSPPPNPPTRTVTSIHNLSFATAAYSWLLENIANPYPSSTVKASLAQQYNCTISAINTWFVNARRRVGWTALCRDHFNNCRADALDAANRALVKEDPSLPLPPRVVHAFVGVKATTENLCATTYAQSTLAGDFDAVVRDMTEKGIIQLPAERAGCKTQVIVGSSKTLEAESQETELVACHYASPDSSCSSSSLPPLDESLTDESEEEGGFPPVLAGRKRRLSCSGPASTSTVKRRKHGRPASCSPSKICLPSSRESMEDPHDKQPTSTPILNIYAPPTQCLTDINETGIPEHPRESIAEPPLHAIPDLLPLSTFESEHSLDEWYYRNFNDLFTLPPPVDVIEPDLSTQWEVELFSDYSIPPEKHQSELPSLPSENQASTSVDSLVLGDFVRSLGFVAPSEPTDLPVTVSATDFSAPHHSSSLSESIDWTALLNWSTSDPSLDDTSGHSHATSVALPELDLSILQLPVYSPLCDSLAVG